MSTRVRRAVNWGSSSGTEEEEEESNDAKYGIKLRELRSMPPSAVTENNVVEPRKRGRGPSKRPCLNRNALMARENRQRKKAYLEKIESKLSFYQQENKTLANTIRKQGIDIKRLTGEVAYLRSVLNNNTSITALLKTINDGLHKISSQRKNNVNNGLYAGQNDIELLHKCSCSMNGKGNVLKSQNTNVCPNMTNDNCNDYSIAQSQLNGDFYNTRKNCNCKSLTRKTVVSPLSEFDHTYTVSKNPTVNTNDYLDSKEVCNTITTTSSLSQASEDSYSDTVKDLDSISMSHPNLTDMDDKKGMDMMSIEFDQFPPFNMNIFDDLPKCDEMTDSIHSLHDASSLFNDEDAFQIPDNSGVCLHVNSDKVSLEFCSICHLNSKNSGLN